MPLELEEQTLPPPCWRHSATAAIPASWPELVCQTKPEFMHNGFSTLAGQAFRPGFSSPTYVFLFNHAAQDLTYKRFIMWLAQPDLAATWTLNGTALTHYWIWITPTYRIAVTMPPNGVPAFASATGFVDPATIW